MFSLLTILAKTRLEIDDQQTDKEINRATHCCLLFIFTRMDALYLAIIYIISIFSPTTFGWQLEIRRKPKERPLAKSNEHKSLLLVLAY